MEGDTTQPVQPEPTRPKDVNKVVIHRLRKEVSGILLEFGFDLNIMEIGKRIQDRAVLIALEECGNNSAWAARILGINRSTLVERRRQMGMVTKRPRSDLYPGPVKVG